MTFQEDAHAWECYLGAQTPTEFMVTARIKGWGTIVEAVHAYVVESDVFSDLSEDEKDEARQRLARYIEDTLGPLTGEDKRLLGALTTRNESGEHFMLAFDGAWLQRMELLCYITINRPRHEATGLLYSQEQWTVEVSPECAEWFDSFGNLYDD